ncbi:MAG: zinc ribbon domain-containing protein [Lachnospiraceae bacterium]|nr:zinc ribbon domain-containing protein [Lachnospiraceae bacterium]
MKCTKCNNEIQQDAAFCSHCGAAVENSEPIKKISLKCEQCNGMLVVDSDKTVLTCPYCGHQTLIIENDAITIERIKTSAHKEIEIERIKSTDRLHQIESEREQRQEEKDQVEKFKKGKWAKFLIIAFLLSAVFTYFYFSSGRILTGILSLIQAGCFGFAWCMGMNIIKEKKRYIHILIAIIGIVLIIPTMRSCGSANVGSNKEKEPEYETIQWSIFDIGNMIPEPKSNKIDIGSNSEKWLCIDVYEMTEGDCYSYIQECEDKYGFNIDVEKMGSSFWAYNEDGYKLHVAHLTEYMSIDLKCPVEFGEYELPDYAINAGLPLPKSEIGHYEWKHDDNFNIKIGNTTFEEYRDYVELCIAAGFTENNQDGKDFYNGDNKKGFELSVHYLGFNTMSISFSSPE